MVQQKISRKLAQVKKGTLHVGVDLGSENNVAVVINEYAERLDRFRFPNDRDGYEYFQRRIEKQQRKDKLMLISAPQGCTYCLIALPLFFNMQGAESFFAQSKYTSRSYISEQELRLNFTKNRRP